MEVGFYGFGEIDNDRLKYAVICASFKGKWIFVRHRERASWETPGGHREAGEDISAAAKRELYEESGAAVFEMEPVLIYSVTDNGATDFGALFYADVKEIGPLPDSETGEVRLFRRLPGNLTYPEIFPRLFGKAAEYLTNRYISLLSSDIVRNINMIQFLRSYPAWSFYRVGGSVLIRGTSDEDWVYISSGSEGEFACLIEGLDDEDRCFAVLEDWMLPAVVRGREISSRLSSIKLVYDKSGLERKYPHELEKCTGSCPNSGKYLTLAGPEVTDLTIPDAPVLYKNSDYKEYISVDYIEERILNGVGVGIRKDGRLVAWALTHDDGAIGFLHVLDAYRRRGYAALILQTMADRLLAAGEVPFLHVEESNAASMNLVLKTGFRKDRRIHWIKLK